MRIDELPWDDLRYLLAVHRHGSFLGAAQALGLSTSTVARRVEALERAVGQSLVQRTTRGARLEQDALTLVAPAEQFETTLRALARDRGEDRSAYAGVVRVTVPDGFGPSLAVAAARVLRVHPETRVEVVVESRFADLAAREADLAVRNGRSSSRVLLEKPLGEIRVGLFASADYVRRRLPKRYLTAEAIADHDYVGLELPTRHGAASWLTSRGATRHPFSSTDVNARIRAAQEGLGLVALAIGLDYAGLERVAIVPALPSLRFYLAMRHDLRKVPRVRVVATAIHEVFLEHLARQDADDARFDRSTSAPSETTRVRSASSRAPRRPRRP